MMEVRFFPHQRTKHIRDMENIKIYYENPEFFVNERKGTVVAKLKYSVVFDLDNYYSYRFCTTCKAKCDESDTFDEEKGKRIALCRCEIESKRNISLEIQKLMRKYIGFVDNLGCCDDDIYENIQHDRRYLSKLMG